MSKPISRAEMKDWANETWLQCLTEAWNKGKRMTDRELFERALDALDSDNPDIQLRTAIALRKRLAQPERPWVGLAQPEQEPVAWMVYTQDGQSVYVTDNPIDIQEGQRALPLYPAPPQRDGSEHYRDMYLKVRDELAELQQRQWVGLTKEEAKEISLANRPYVIDMIAALEARLKEKNT
jgi:hypothetical protein